MSLNEVSGDALRGLHADLQAVTKELKEAMEDSVQKAHESKVANMRVMKLKLDKDVIMDAIMTEKKLIEASK